MCFLACFSSRPARVGFCLITGKSCSTCSRRFWRQSCRLQSLDSCVSPFIPFMHFRKQKKMVSARLAHARDWSITGIRLARSGSLWVQWTIWGHWNFRLEFVMPQTSQHTRDLPNLSYACDLWKQHLVFRLLLELGICLAEHVFVKYNKVNHKKEWLVHLIWMTSEMQWWNITMFNTETNAYCCTILYYTWYRKGLLKYRVT